MRPKTVFLILFSLFSLLLLGLFLFSKTETAREYVKAVIERRLNDIPNLEVSIGDMGTAAVSRIEMENVEVRIAGEDFASIEKISTDYSIPLLYSMISRRKIRLSNTEIDGLRLILSRNEAGTWNFKKLKREDAPRKEPEKPRPSLVFENNSIRVSRVSIDDRLRDRLLEFDLVEESLFSVTLVELTKKVELRARDMNFDYASSGIRVRNLGGKIDFASWNCVFEDAKFSVQDVGLRGSGTITNLREPLFRTTVFVGPVGLNGSGALTLRAETDVKMRSLDDMTGTVRAAAVDSFLNGEALRTELEPLRFSGTRVSLGGTLAGGFGESSAKGYFDFARWLGGGEKNEFDFNATLVNVTADDIVRALDFPPDSVKLGENPRIDSEMRVSGHWATGEDYSFGVFSRDFRAVDGQDGSLSAEGTATFRPDGAQVDLKLGASGFRVRSDLANIGLDNRFDGEVSLAGTIPAGGSFLEKADLRVTADLSTDEFRGIGNARARGEAGISGGEVTVGRLSVDSDDFFFSSEKKAGSEETLDFKFASRDLGFLSAFSEKLRLSGSAASRGTISGSVFAPLVEADSRIENFGYGEDYAAAVVTVSSTVRIDPENPAVEASLEAERTRVLGNHPDSARARISGTDRRVEINSVLAKKDGSFVSSLVVAENLFSDEKRITVRELEGMINEKPLLASGDVAIVLSPKRMEIAGESFVYGEGKVENYAGKIDREREILELRAEMTDFPQDLASKVLNFRNELGGSLSGKIDVSGPFDAPDARADLVSRKLSHGTFAADELAVKLRGEKGRLSLDLTSFAGADSSLSARGRIGVFGGPGGFLKRLAGTSVDLELNSREYGLGFVSVLTDSLERTEGTFSCESLRLGGTLSSPLINGETEVRGLKILLDRLKNDLSAETVRFSFDGEKIVLPETEIRSGGGRARVSGEMDLTDFTYSAEMEMENFRFNPHSLKTDVSGRLRLRRKDGILRISGDAGVAKGRIRIYPTRLGRLKDVSFVGKNGDISGEFSVEESESSFYREETELDILLNISSGSWIKTKDANLKANGKLRLEKKAGAEHSLQGNVVSSEGYYTAFGKLFQVESGTLNFAGGARNPDLDIRAHNRVNEVDIYVNVSGDIGAPEFSLSSTPPLEEVDIVSHLVFGTSSNKLQDRQRAFVGKFATAIAAGGISEIISSEIGLDLLSIREGERGLEDSTLEVGSYVTKDVFVAYERSPSVKSLDPVNQMQNKLKLEWRMNRMFSVESQLGGENSGADFFYNFNF